MNNPLSFGKMDWNPAEVPHLNIQRKDDSPQKELKPKTQQPHLFIVRGHPGAGKTTIAQTLISEGMADIYHEQDHYFTNDKGVYIYLPELTDKAVVQCAVRVADSLSKGLRVVVANNFTKVWTVEKYIETAQRYGATWQIIRATGNYPNVMGVPESQVQFLKKIYEPHKDDIVL